MYEGNKVIESALTSTPLMHDIPRACGLTWPFNWEQILAANWGVIIIKNGFSPDVENWILICLHLWRLSRYRGWHRYSRVIWFQANIYALVSLSKRLEILDILPSSVDYMWQLLTIYDFLVNPQTQYRMKQLVMLFQVFGCDLRDCWAPNIVSALWRK